MEVNPLNLEQDFLRDQLVSISEFGDLAHDVKPISDEFLKLGKLLQLSESKLEELEYLFSNHPGYGISEVVREWCCWNCDRTRYGNPSLRWFLNAVKEIDPELSIRLEKKYLDDIEEEKERLKNMIRPGILDKSFARERELKRKKEKEEKEKKEKEEREKKEKEEREKKEKENNAK